MKNTVLKNLFVSLVLLLISMSAWSDPGVSITITSQSDVAQPIAIVPFKFTSASRPPLQDVSQVVEADLKRSGRFAPISASDMLAKPFKAEQVNYKNWQSLGISNLIVGEVVAQGAGRYIVRFQLVDIYNQQQITGYEIPTSENNLRATAHKIADIIFEKLTGESGSFSTRVAYITSKKIAGTKAKRRLALNISDADGYKAQTILSSSEPIMSPAWSPDGRKLAYVSFEGGRPGIFVQEVFTGRRQKVTSYRGINGAPAWSPDGKRLALTLSKDGNPDIFVLDLASRQLRKLTRHYGIDTEASWSPDGRHIIFTSDRGGAPQIYRISSHGGAVERLTYDGSYNSRASYAPDGKSITMVTRRGRAFRIGVMDLQSRHLRVLTQKTQDESPSFSPNGTMIIYATKSRGRGELAAVSVDGRVKQRLAIQDGDVREPVWSPYTAPNRRN